MTRSSKGLIVVLFSLAGSSALLSTTAAQDPAAQRQQIQEEETDYYREWLHEDVVYIITPEERTVFSQLTTDEEKERFIEQFWRRRDPDIRTAQNEFREEHYRRIAYANENFTSGIEGWRSDRGRIYIIHGEPDEIQSKTAGSVYNRPFAEGGGTTRTYPYETWRYRHLDAIGDDVILEFVDKSFTGSFQLALTPWEKDMLLRGTNQGKTLAEELGAASRSDHPVFHPSIQELELYPFMMPGTAQRPFERMETVFKVQQVAPIKYKDLQELVKVNINYSDLNFGIREDYLRLNDAQTLVPITLEWQNRDLTFVPEGETGTYRAKIAVYGIVTSLTNEIVSEFDDEVVSTYTEANKEYMTIGRSLYQKVFPLKAGGRYKLTLVTKDLNSDRVGVEQRGLILPRFDREGLTASTVILSDFVRRLQGADLEKEDLMFVMGDLWIRPNVSKVFQSGEDLGIYLQVYHATLDNQSLQPQLEVKYRIEGKESVIYDQTDVDGKSIDYFSGQRVVLLKVLRLTDLPPGDYSMIVEVRDKVAGDATEVREHFKVAG